MPKEKLSLTQIFTLVVNFLLGSSVVIGVGMEAKQNAWIVVLFGMFIGIFIMSFYLYLMSLLPGKNLYEIMEYCLPRPIYMGLTILYSIYFIYIACKVIRGFGEMIISVILPNTPMEFSILVTMLLIAYILYNGIEVLGRTSEIFTPYTFVFIILLVVLLYSGENINWYNLQPIAPMGIIEVIKSSIPVIFAFPFGELVVFMAILSSVSNFKMSWRVCLFSVFLASILLLTSVVLIIGTLGAETALRSTFPLLSAARLVKIGDFLERIDALVVFIMMLGILIICSIFMYGGLKGLESLTKIPFRYFSLPVASIITLFSIFLSMDYSEHIIEGLQISIFFLHLPFSYIFPMFLLILLLVKKRKKDKKGMQVNKT